MSDRCCAYCGCRPESLQVDHYLPVAHFPRLAYCWANMLPACWDCNCKRKRDYRPLEIEPHTFVDPVLADGVSLPTRIYAPTEVLPEFKHRLVEPTVDDPAEHLEFVPALHGFKAKTSIGEETIRRLFADRRELAKRLEALSDAVRDYVITAADVSELVRNLTGTEAMLGLRSHIAAYAIFHIRLCRPTWATDALHAFAAGSQ